MQIDGDSGIVKGRGSGVQVGDTDTISSIIEIREIDFEKDIEGLLLEFEEKHKDSPIEYAYIMSPKGKMIALKGTNSHVNTRLAGAEYLENSVSIHNHPLDNSYADSFSADDFREYFHDKASAAYLISDGKNTICHIVVIG